MEGLLVLIYVKVDEEKGDTHQGDLEEERDLVIHVVEEPTTCKLPKCSAAMSLKKPVEPFTFPRCSFGTSPAFRVPRALLAITMSKPTVIIERIARI
jgi:hypothetical protein